jgi:hypothetical protein
MTATITLLTAGVDTQNFSLYSNLDGFTVPFEINVSKLSLLGGYSSTLIPDFTLIVRVKSTGNCVNYVDILLINPINCVLSEWSEFTVCTNNKKTRTRTIITPATEGGIPCGPLTEIVDCGELASWIGGDPYCELT